MADPWLVPLHDTVFVGYADIACAGSRALLGVAGTKESKMFDVPRVHQVIPCCTLALTSGPRPGKKVEKQLNPFIVYNCKYMQYSLVILNTHVPARSSHAVIKYLLDACSHSEVHKVYLLSAVHVDLSNGPIRRLYENTWNGMIPGTNCPSLPRDTKLCDAMLNNFIQMFLADGIPFSCLTAPAHKADAGCAGQMDGSADVIATFQEYLSDITSMGFSLDISCSLSYDVNMEENADMIAMIYV